MLRNKKSRKKKKRNWEISPLEFSVQCLASWESSLGFGVTIQDLFAHSYHENQSILEEISPEYSLEGLMLKLKLQYFEHVMWRVNSLEKKKKKKNPDTGKDWGQEEKGATEDEMVGWHHQLTGHEFEQAPGDGEGQGSLGCHSPWGHKESDTIEWLNNNKIKEIFIYLNFWYLWITWGLCL